MTKANWSPSGSVDGQSLASGENRWRRSSVSTFVSGDPSDDELLRATAAGDRRAFEQYYRRNAPWLEIRLRRRCSDAELAADVLQEVFLVVWRAAASYRGNGQAGGWLWSIATRRLIDAHRRRLARSSVVGEPHDDLMPVPSAEETALAATYDARLAQALSGLSPELRAVLQATVLDGLSVRETSVLLNMPEGTVKSRAARARRQLREALA
jgi:RNA polymerase sigma-70 factor (ECF subfamily)